MALINNAPPPLGDPIAQQTRKEFKAGEDPQAGLCSQPWGDWFTALLAVLEKAPGRVFSVSLTGQRDSIAATDMTDGQLTAGLYRLSYFTHITQADGIASDLQVTLDWRADGVLLTFNGALISNNTDTTYQSGSPGAAIPGEKENGGLIWIDALSEVRYSTTYLSTTPNEMIYTLYVMLEEVSA